MKGKAPGKKEITVTGSNVPSAKISMTVLETKPKTFKLYNVNPIEKYNFPIIIQLVSSDGKTLAVTTEPVQIFLISSNITNISTPSTITINPESTDTLSLCQALGTKTSKITLQSEGFTTFEKDITPAAANMDIKLSSIKTQYKEAETATVKATVTLDGSPVEGMKVKWTGSGLSYTETTSGADGVSENKLMIKAGSNKIDALINFGEGGTDTDTITLTGVIGVFTLKVHANPTSIQLSGSGSYQLNESVYLDAPAQISMSGIFGMLGAKYVFKQWTGFIQSDKNTEILKISGNSKDITVTAVYGEDYFMMYVTIGVALLIILIAVYIYMTRIRKTIVIKTK